MFSSYFITPLYWDPFFSVEGEAEKQEKGAGGGIQCAQPRPIQSTKTESWGRYNLQKHKRWIPTGRYKTIFILFSANQPTNEPTHPITTTECRLVLQKGLGFSLLCLFLSSMLPSSLISSLLPVCFFCCLAPAVQAFTFENHIIRFFFKSLFALLTDTSSRT